jgi:phenylacetic acid degradation operon negative regulatory protein
MSKPELDATVCAATEQVDLPRAQTGSQPQHLLTTLLGDYWLGHEEHLPSAALVRLVGEFGVTPVGARAALSRLTRRGLLTSSKSGRRTYYGLTGRAAKLLEEGRERIMAFGTSREPWDGRWTVAAFSVPEDQRDLRHALRTRLRWLGFAPLYDGMWVSPRDAVQPALEALAEVEVERATVLTATVAPDGPVKGEPIAAWDLDHLRKLYEEFIAAYEPMLDRARHGSVGASEALIARTAVMDTWRNFPNLDPELPDELLPDGWPRQRARAIFAEVYNRLGPLAEVRVRQVLSEFAPDLSGFVRHHTASALDEPAPEADPRHLDDSQDGAPDGRRTAGATAASPELVPPVRSPASSPAPHLSR